ncbi:hypothetical protein ACKC9G_04450 [Pokkaliibacter sp. CJK22405]|uniref:hypothetical protein n=1 Tax=Pokkaliibacter sp. CJK22405 TaxID=3384615 RepID=UPI003984B3DF
MKVFTVRFLTCLSLLLGMLISSQSFAYSYAAAGKEPLIDGRETLMTALANKDKSTATTTLDSLNDELVYLEEHHNVVLIKPMHEAVDALDSARLDKLLNLAYKAEIERRLEGAGDNLSDYQTAKVLVVKSKKFLDLLQSGIPADDWKRAEDALSQALESIGNPGVFGVGTKAPDPKAFEAAEKSVMDALGSVQG